MRSCWRFLVEKWLAIPGTDGLYSISSHGRVRSEPVHTSNVGRVRGRILSPRASRKGYLIFRVCLRNGMQWQTSVHRAVAAAFIGPCDDGMQVNHKDGDKTNNRPENLEYVSCRDNVRHCWVNGLHSVEHCQGEANNKAKLTEDDVRSIRAIHPAKSLDELAVLFGVTKQAVWCVVKRKTWAHV